MAISKISWSLGRPRIGLVPRANCGIGLYGKLGLRRTSTFPLVLKPVKNAGTFRKQFSTLEDQGGILIFQQDHPIAKNLISILGWIGGYFFGTIGLLLILGRNEPIPPEYFNDIPQWRKDFGESKFRVILGAVYLLNAFLLGRTAFSWVSRSILYLRLSKDHKQLNVETYSPFFMFFASQRTVPLDSVSIKYAGKRMGLRIGEEKFIYVLNSHKATFPNPELFKKTVAARPTIP